MYLQLYVQYTCTNIRVGRSGNGEGEEPYGKGGYDYGEGEEPYGKGGYDYGEGEEPYGKGGYDYGEGEEPYGKGGYDLVWRSAEGTVCKKN